jgi:hypothetical protein
MNSRLRNQRAACYGSAIVLVNLVVNLLHGAAHRELHIGLSGAQTLFVVVVILAGPLLAMALLWTVWQRLGLGLLALTMAASLLFGLYHHFVAMGPDHVGVQVAGFWGTTFAVTSWLLFLAEGVGTYLGLRYLYRAPTAV